MAAKVISKLGYIMLIAGSGLILTGITGLYMKGDFSAVMDLMSPFNVLNYIMILITLAPGFLCIWLSDRLRKR